MPPWSEIARRIGGKRGISVAVFLVSTPFWTLGLVFNESSTFESSRNAWVLLALAVVGQAVMGLTLLLAHLTVARHRAEKPVPVWLMVVIWSSSSITRLIVIVFGLALFEIPNDVPLLTRILSSSAMASVGFAIGAYGLDAFDRYREERARLLHKLLEEEGQLSSHRDTIEGMKTTLLAQVDERIRDSSTASAHALDRLEEAFATRQDIRPAMDELRELSDHTWQKISQDLWAQAPSRPPRVRLVELLSLWARSHPFNIPILALLGGFLYLLLYSRVFEPVTGAVVTATWLGLTVLLALLANALLARARKTALALLLVSVAVMVFSAIPLIELLEYLGVVITEYERIVAVHGISVLLVISASIPPSLVRSREEVLNNLREHITQKTLEKLRVESQLAVVTQKIANHLHGDIRGNFLASMLTLQGHLDRKETAAAQRTIRKIRELLAQPVTMTESTDASSPDLETFLNNWSALIDITMNKPLTAFPEVFRPALHTIIVDAVNNAVRHGAADWIRITLTNEPGAVVVKIQNNGNPNSANREGLGTANLNSLAPDMWNRMPVGQGITQLLVRLDQSHLESSLSRG